MSEIRQLIVVIVVTALIGVIGVVIANSITKGGGDLTADYYAKITISKNLTLEECYVYHVKKTKYRMLYRYWKVPLVVSGSLNEPHIKLLDVKTNGTAYAKDYSGRVFVFNKYASPLVYVLVERLANRNEVGFIMLPHFSIGNYKAKYVFEIHPPIETDRKIDHLNLKLADEHIPYPTVRIEIYDPTNSILELYPHMDSYKVEKIENGWIIEGWSNGLVEIEFLLKHNAVNGFIRYVDGVESKTKFANTIYFATRNFISGINLLATALVLGFPIFIVYVYRKYGKEKEYVVPEFLSYIPKKRKPWLVNLVFHGDAFKCDENAFYATLLDLQRRGYIEIEPYESKGKIRRRKELRIKVLKRDTDDRYERSVLNFLDSFLENGVFDTRKLRRLAKDKDEARRIASWFDVVMKYTDRISEEFVENRGKTIFSRVMLITVILSIVSFIAAIPVAKLYPNTISFPILMLTMFAQALVCILTPTQLFGRWKGDYYKEKLEWDAFKKFLSNFAMIKKYAPEDIAIWKDWLIYGTALGVGEKVAKAMESLNIKIPEVTTFYGFGTFHAIGKTAARTISGGGGGGGFGAGGGFGGGGAGGR